MPYRRFTVIRFKLIDKAPILVEVLGTDYRLPRFKRKHWLEWRAEEMQKRAAEATAHMDPEQRARVLLMYPPKPLTNAELRALVYTADGTGRVFRQCASDANVPEEVIAKVVDDGEIDETDLETISLMLSGIVSPDDVARRLQSDEMVDRKGDRDNPSATPGEDEQGEEEQDDPLTRGTRGSAL